MDNDVKVIVESIIVKVGKLFVVNGPESTTVYANIAHDPLSYMLQLAKYQGKKLLPLNKESATRMVLFAKPPFKELEDGVTFVLTNKALDINNMILVNRDKEDSQDDMALCVYEYLVKGVIPADFPEGYSKVTIQ